jgi:hypothetical protein
MIQSLNLQLFILGHTVSKHKFLPPTHFIQKKNNNNNKNDRNHSFVHINLENRYFLESDEEEPVSYKIRGKIVILIFRQFYPNLISEDH